MACCLAYLGDRHWDQMEEKAYPCRQASSYHPGQEEHQTVEEAFLYLSVGFFSVTRSILPGKPIGGKPGPAPGC